jgi:hypothetical protein
VNSARPAERYGDTGFRRMVLAPGLLAAIVLLVGIALIGQELYMYVSWVTAVLALICLTFVIQAKQWWWAPLFAAIAIAWNPVAPFGFDGVGWLWAHYAAVAVFIAAGILVKTPVPADEPRR